jgi:hypothetical protein
MGTSPNCITDSITGLKSNQVHAVYNQLGTYDVHHNEVYAFKIMELIKYFTLTAFMT